jgi:4-amino-4-deoxy-L-arabinose transferase-like glycosyltransferase
VIAGLRARVRRLPLACWLVVLLAFLHGSAWAVLTPSFQGPDEIAHYGYAEYVAQTGKWPTKRGPYAVMQEDTQVALERLPWSVVGKPSWSPGTERELDAMLDRLDRRGVPAQELGATYQAPNPPLYAYLLAIPYRATELIGGTVFDRLLVLRLATAAIGALAVLFVLLLLRELFPRRRWAWIAGGAAVALQPVFGFLVGTVNNDVPVIAAGAALLWLLARVYRRGLTWPLAGGIAGALAIGLLSKLSAFGLLAVAVWGLLVLGVVQRERWRTHLPRALVAIGLGALPVVLFLVLRGGVPIVALTADGVGNVLPATEIQPRNYRGFVSYLWQFWLPKLPFMDEQFPGYPHYALWETYIQAFAGRFGWFEYGFSPDASRTMSWTLGLLGVGASVAVVQRRSRWRELLPMLTVLLGAFVGYAVMVNLAGWGYRLDNGANFEQVRYLFPMLGTFGVLVAAAVVAFPCTWERGLVVVVLLAATLHVLASWGLTLTRYYM